MTVLKRAKHIEKEIKALGIDVQSVFDGQVYDISTDKVSLLIDCEINEWELNSPNFVDYSNSKDPLWSRKLEDLPYIFRSVATNKLKARRVRLKRRLYYEKNGHHFDVDSLEPMAN